MDLFQQSASVVMIIILLIVVLWALRARKHIRIGFRGHQRAGMLECVDRLALTHQHSVFVLRAGTEMLIVGVSPSGMSLIREMNAGTAKSVEERR